LSVALDDPAPALVPLLLAVILTPRATWRFERGAHWRGRTLLTTATALTALFLTLLLPDGLTRWIVIAVIAGSFLAFMHTESRLHAVPGDREHPS
jgi:hypothetical protein